jgi:hypothetical protein
VLCANELRSSGEVAVSTTVLLCLALTDRLDSGAARPPRRSV